eukprot:g3254.t1
MDVEESIMTITPAEREFFAEDEKVVIMPNFTGGMINLIAGNFGPFQPQMKVEVPLWLAVALKKRNRCNIQPPVWLNADYLDVKLKEDQEERNRPTLQGENTRYPLPFYFIEISHVLLNEAPDDVEDSERVRCLLEDIQNLRMAKLREGSHMMMKRAKSGENPMASLAGVSSMELGRVHDTFLESLNKLTMFRRETVSGRGGTQSQSSVTAQDKMNQERARRKREKIRLKRQSAARAAARDVGRGSPEQHAQPDAGVPEAAAAVAAGEAAATMTTTTTTTTTTMAEDGKVVEGDDIGDTGFAPIPDSTVLGMQQAIQETADATVGGEGAPASSASADAEEATDSSSSSTAPRLRQFRRA